MPKKARGVPLLPEERRRKELSDHRAAQANYITRRTIAHTAIADPPPITTSAPDPPPITTFSPDLPPIATSAPDSPPNATFSPDPPPIPTAAPDSPPIVPPEDPILEAIQSLGLDQDPNFNLPSTPQGALTTPQRLRETNTPRPSVARYNRFATSAPLTPLSARKSTRATSASSHQSSASEGTKISELQTHQDTYNNSLGKSSPTNANISRPRVPGPTGYQSQIAHPLPSFITRDAPAPLSGHNLESLSEDDRSCKPYERGTRSIIEARSTESSENEESEDFSTIASETGANSESDYYTAEEDGHIGEVPDSPPSPESCPESFQYQQMNRVLAHASRYTCGCKTRPFLDHFLPPLHHPKILTRDGPHNDFRNIQWESLLAGKPEPPRLDFAASERNCLERISDLNIQLDREWDVDSFIAHVTTLAVHKSAFKLTFCPPYLQRITQNQRITINGYAPHRCKHIRLGYSVSSKGWGYDTYVLFPHMKMPPWFRVKNPANTASTYVSHDYQNVWIDHIIIPALEATCGTKILSRYPATFEDAYHTACINKEVSAGSGQPIDPAYPIPAENLRAFWARVKDRANQRPEFRNPTLMLCAHGFKSTVPVNRKNPNEMRMDFLAYLDMLFDTSPDIMPPREAYLDIGFDDSPTHGGVTLLLKEPCLQQWGKGFHCPQSNQARTNVALYPWMMTRDAASMSVELGSRNDLRARGDLVYPKAYNTIFNLFSSPAKNILPFSNSLFEALGFSQSEIDRYATINRRGPDAYVDQQEADAQAQQVWIKARMIQEFEQVINRLDRAIKGASQGFVDPTLPHESGRFRPAKSYGVRQEYRISLAAFRELDFSEWDVATQRPLIPTAGSTVSPGPSSAASPNLSADDFRHVDEFESSPPRYNPPGLLNRTSPPPHQRFWILDTQEVLEFMSALINRWLLPLEALIAQSRPEAQREVASIDSQRLHSVTISILLRTLRLTFGGFAPQEFQALWKAQWTEKTKRWRRRPTTQRDGPDSGSGRVTRYGLDYQGILKTHGIISLPQLFLWEGLLSIRPDIIPRLGLTNAFQQHFRVQRDIATLVTRQDRVLGRLRELVLEVKSLPNTHAWRDSDTSMRFYSTAAELVIQIYVKRVWEILKQRLTKGLKRQPAQRARRQFDAILSPSQRQGLEGLTYSSVSRVLGFEPRITFIRQAKLEDNRHRYFLAYHSTGFWVDRLRALFYFGDREDELERKWEQEPFRTFTRQVYGIIEDELDTTWAEDWLNYLVHFAARKLLIIPHYDNSRAYVEYQGAEPNRHSPEVTHTTWPRLQRLNWIVAVIPRRLRDYYPAACGTAPVIDAQRSAREQQAAQRICKATITKFHNLKVAAAEMSKDERATRIVKDPKTLGLDVHLSFAADFLAGCHSPEDTGSDKDNSSTQSEQENSSGGSVRPEDDEF
ncbi:MAG: hypothetical protein LQ341_000296 [Variospora aurantia]|nr:MAG: hypothetical protein LQ341_000296 [Variospora aurantia]